MCSNNVHWFCVLVVVRLFAHHSSPTWSLNKAKLSSNHKARFIVTRLHHFCCITLGRFELCSTFQGMLCLLAASSSSTTTTPTSPPRSGTRQDIWIQLQIIIIWQNSPDMHHSSLIAYFLISFNDIWFQPESFLPERFLKGEGGFSKPAHFQVKPFHLNNYPIPPLWGTYMYQKPNYWWNLVITVFMAHLTTFVQNF